MKPRILIVRATLAVGLTALLLTLLVNGLFALILVLAIVVILFYTF